MQFAEYLFKVLGVRQILMPPLEEAAIEVPADPESAILIVMDEPPASSPAGKDSGRLKDSLLFQKMMEAIGLKLEQIQIYELSSFEFREMEIRLPDQVPVLCFSSELFSAIAPERIALGNVFVSFGPKTLAQETHLKRQAWADLQKLALVLKSVH